MTAFHIVLERAGSQTAQKVYHRLHLIAQDNEIRRAMLHNLFEETNFRETDWNHLIASLSATEPDPTVIENTVRMFCRTARKDSRPSGPEARPATRFLGRIIPFETLLNIYVEQPAGKILPRDLARSALRGIIGVSPTALASTMRSLPLGNFIMWSTFDIVGSGTPFDRPLPPLPSLLARLGLDPKDAREPHLVLEYRLPDTVLPRVPTFCDAYSGAKWNQWFRVSPNGAAFGRTRPVGRFEARGLPEVVHSVITTAELETPITQL